MRLALSLAIHRQPVPQLQTTARKCQPAGHSAHLAHSDENLAMYQCCPSVATKLLTRCRWSPRLAPPHAFGIAQDAHHATGEEAASGYCDDAPCPVICRCNPALTERRRLNLGFENLHRH